MTKDVVIEYGHDRVPSKTEKAELENPSELSQDLKSVEAGVLHNWRKNWQRC